MSTIVVYATDQDGQGKTMEIGRYSSIYDIELPVGHFAPDVVITFEEDMNELAEARRKRKGWPVNTEGSDQQST